MRLEKLFSCTLICLTVAVNIENNKQLSQLINIFCNLNAKTIHLYYENNVSMNMNSLIHSMEQQCNPPLAVVVVR